MDIAVNLYNGEHVSKKGVLITITPLNGNGSSFKSVTITVNGVNAYSGAPNEQGTASWTWKPQQQPGSQATVIVTVTTDQGQTITKTFNVAVTGTGQTPGTVVVNTSQTPKTSSVLPVSVIHLIQKMPGTVIYTFPYVLFWLLAITIGVSAWGAWKEISAANKLKFELHQLDLVNSSRRNFVDLASHYLRTPLTLMNGGLELLTDSPLQSSLKQPLASLGTQIDRLITEQETSSQETSIALPQIKPAYRQMFFWIPVAVCVGLTLLFDFLASQASVLSLRSVSVYTQVLVATALIVASYMAIRLQLLGRRKKQIANRQVSEAQALLTRREQFLHDATQTLSGLLSQLRNIMVGVDSVPAKKFMTDGLQRIEGVVRTFTIADRLRGTRSKKPYESVPLHEPLEYALQEQQHKIQEKGIRIKEQGSTVLCTLQYQTLLRHVCTHILDNAVSYAPEKSMVTMDTHLDKDEAVIAVSDEGAGIPEEQQKALFEPFTKAEGSKTFNHEGMGISLYLDMLIMTYLGGKISIESHPGRTKVQLSLPFKPV